MKTWYLLAAAVAYYLYSQTPAQKLATVQASALPSVAGNQVVNVTSGLQSDIALLDVPVYSFPTDMLGNGGAN